MWRLRVAPASAARIERSSRSAFTGFGKQVHGLLPAGELVLREHDDAALATLPRHHDRRATFDRLVQIAGQILRSSV